MRPLEMVRRKRESRPALCFALLLQRLTQNLLTALVIALAAVVLAGCTLSAHRDAGRRATPARTADDGASTGQSSAAAIPADDIPSCFIEGEPAARAGPERVDVFQPAPRSLTPTPRSGTPDPATPRPTPEVAKIAAEAVFPLYALNAPGSEIAPLQMRISTVPAGNTRQISLFTLQYRIVAQRGSIVVMMSSPSAARTPVPNDVDDVIDALRLEARLSGTPRAADPLVDPSAAFRSAGCPVRESTDVQIEGRSYPAMRVTWPGLPRVNILRVETGHGALTIEAGAIDRATLLALPVRLVSLHDAPQTVAALQQYFGGVSLLPPGKPGRTATPVR